MDMTDMMVMGTFGFMLALVVHITGALILFGAYAAETFSVAALRLAHSVDQVRLARKVSKRLPMIYHIAAAAILVSGFYMGYEDLSHHEPVGWVAVALVLFLIIGFYGALTANRTSKIVNAALKVSGGKMTPELRKATRRPEPVRQLGFSIFSIFGILTLMIFQPSVLISVMILVIAVILGLATAQLIILPKKRFSKVSKPAETESIEPEV